MAYRDIDLKVRCPYCAAGPGVWCRKRTLQRYPPKAIRPTQGKSQEG